MLIFRFLLTIVIFWGIAMSTLALGRVVETSNLQALVSVGSLMDQLIEDGRHYTLAELQSPDLSGKFKPVGGETVRVSPGVQWLRFQIQVPQDRPWYLVLDEWMLDLVQVYRQLPDGGVKLTESGLTLDIKDREVPFRNCVLRLPPQTNSNGSPAIQTFYVRIESSLLAAQIPVWMGTIAPLLQHETIGTSLIAAIIGIFLVLGAIGIVLLAGTRERVWGVFASLAMLSAFLFTVTSGMGLDLWGADLSRSFIVMEPAFFQVFLILVLLLMMQFLDEVHLKLSIRRLVIVTMFFCAGVGFFDVVLPVSNLFTVKLPLLTLSLAVVSLVRIIVLLIALRGGLAMARIYLVAFSMEIIGSAIYFSGNVGLLPENLWTIRASTLGAILMLVLVCYGVSVRLRLLTKEVILNNARLSVLNTDLEQKVSDRTIELEQERNKLLLLAMEDELTGLLSRRNILDQLEQEYQRYRRYQVPFSVLMLDLDHFKKINDTWGHLVGDQVLRQMATILKATLRDTDKTGRLGGEEILVILPQTAVGPAMHAGEKLRESIARLQLQDPTGNIFHVTCSIGVAEIKADDNDIQRILQESDAAMYRAKQAGRNRVALAG